MKGLAEFYNKKILDESFKELKIFVNWCNKVYGYHPIIVGGWAVWAYAKHAKSRDIDVVFPTAKSVHELLSPYYAARGFKSTGILTKEYFREVKTKDGIQAIYLDGCSYSNKNFLKEERIEIPWDLVEKNSREWKFNGFMARIPQPEVLLIFKAKALRDRQFEQKDPTISEDRQAFLSSKIDKDKKDINALLEKAEINQEKLEKLLKKLKFEKYFNEIIEEQKK